RYLDDLAAEERGDGQERHVSGRGQDDRGARAGEPGDGEFQRLDHVGDVVDQRGVDVPAVAALGELRARRAQLLGQERGQVAEVRVGGQPGERVQDGRRRAEVHLRHGRAEAAGAGSGPLEAPAGTEHTGGRAVDGLPQGYWHASGPRRRVTGSAPAVDDVLQVPPVDVDTLESGRPQVFQLRAERDDVPDVVVPARLLQRRPVVTAGGPLGILAIAHPVPGGLDDGILGQDRVVVEVPAAGGERGGYLGEQAPLAVVGQVVDAHGGHHGVERRRDLRGPLAGRHVELDIPVAPRERLHLRL